MGKYANVMLDSLPTFKCLIPSKGKTVTLRSFVVKEQKLLMIAKQSEGQKLEGIVGAVTQLIQNCVMDKSVDVSKLPSFDIEYMFVQLYMHSLGTKQTKTFYRCLNPVLDEAGKEVIDPETDEPAVCGQANGVIVNLGDAVVKTDEIQDGMIKVGNKGIAQITLTYPNFDQITRHDLALSEDDPEETFKVYAECITHIYKDDGSFDVAGDDFSVEDAAELLELLPQEVFDKVLAFFINTPSISAETGFVCRKCGHKAEIHLRGLADFF